MQSPVKNLSDDEFYKLIESRSITQMARTLKIVSTKAVKTRLLTLDPKDYDKIRLRKVPKYEIMPIADVSKIVSECMTWTKIGKDLGYGRAGFKNAPLRKFLTRNNISYAHLATGPNWYFTENGKNVIKQAATRLEKPLSEILVDNSTYDSGNGLKKKLFKEGLLENVCALCRKLPEDNNGEILVLQLDHINGKHNDNQLKNLRILCPDCHSKTDTWGSRNTAYLTEAHIIERKEHELSNIKNCQDCKVTISPKSTYCRKCSSKHNSQNRRKAARPNLDQLLTELENMSYRAVGDKYGVTDNAIKKWIRADGGIPPKKYATRKQPNKTNAIKLRPIVVRKNSAKPRPIIVKKDIAKPRPIIIKKSTTSAPDIGEINEMLSNCIKEISSKYTGSIEITNEPCQYNNEMIIRVIIKN